MPASTYTLSQIRSDIQRALTDPSLDSTYIDRLTNNAIQAVSVEYEDPTQEKTFEDVYLAANTRSYSLSAIDPLCILSVKDVTADLRLYPLTRDQAEGSYRESDTGTPAHYHLYGTVIEVYPLVALGSTHVGDRLRIRYIQRPATLTVDEDVLPFTSELDMAVKEYAKFLAYADLNEPDRAAGSLRIALGILQSRKNRRAREYARDHHAARPYWS